MNGHVGGSPGPAQDSAVGERIVARLSHLNGRVRAEANLSEFTTFGVGGPAVVLAEPRSIDELIDVALAARNEGLAVVAVGQGSNLLVADTGVNACVVVLGAEFQTITRAAANPQVVVAGGAVKLPVLARQTVAMGLTGLEWAVGVPGSVGGGVRMNAGGHGSDIAATLVSVIVVRTYGDQGPSVVARVELAASDLGLGYRRSNLIDGDLVVSATFQLEPGDQQRGEAELREIVRWRREHQPGGANCGSVFTNPPGDSAGRLIDVCGLKGHRVGTAAISEKHANFIQADPNASAEDISALIVFVSLHVKERFGVDLHAEVQTLGINSLRRYNSPSSVQANPESSRRTPR